MIKLYAALGVVVLVILLAAYLRIDAASDEREWIKSETNASRIQDIIEDRRADDDVSRLDDTSLFERASQWLLGGDTDG